MENFLRKINGAVTKEPDDKIPQRQKTPPTKYPKFDHTSIINYLTFIYNNIL